MVRNNKMLTSRHKKAPESFDSEAMDHDYYIWVKKSNCKRPDWSLTTGMYDNLEEFFLQNHLNLYKVCLSKSDSVIPNGYFYRTRNGTVSSQNGSFEFLAPNSTTAKSFKFFTAF